MQSSSFYLVVITPNVITSEQLDLIPDLMKEGAAYVYIRSQLSSSRLQQGYMNLLEQGFASRLILPSFLDQKEAGDNYKHIKEWERYNREQKYLADVSYSTSVHTLEDIVDIDPAFKLVFYSPLFPSISKEGYKPKAELSNVQQELRKLKANHYQLPRIIGLGGITANNIKQVKQAGFDGAALLGSVWQSPDPVLALRSIKAALEN